MVSKRTRRVSAALDSEEGMCLSRDEAGGALHLDAWLPAIEDFQSAGMGSLTRNDPSADPALRRRCAQVPLASDHVGDVHDQVPFRPNRTEPRAINRRPKPYPLLNKPRRKFKEIPHRNRY